ncbi:hypothetical protein BGX27_002868 [Mortierella sp. AM989]|nr:hypothetical protein BGX27_002868 [Mortierella sp. AM989]
MIMTTSTATSPLASSANSISHASPSSRPITPTSSDSLTGRHLIYRGLTKSSMEYMSLAHSNKQPEAAHTLKGEILISGRNQPGYIQYNITLDQEWKTRRVLLTARFDGSQEKRLVLEVDQDQRWYKVTEHRLARSRSFFRSGVNSPVNVVGTASSSSPRPSSNLGRDAGAATEEVGRVSSESMQDIESNFSEASSYSPTSSFSSSSSDVESAIPFEKINLTWTPPPKGSKRGSKRFSSFNPLKDMSQTLSSFSSTLSSSTELISPVATMSCSESCATTTTTTTTTVASPTRPPLMLSTSPSRQIPCFATLSPTSSRQISTAPGILRSPVVEFANRSLSKSSSSSSLNGSTHKTYEHLPSLDGCIHLDLGSDISPSTLLLPLRRATLGIDPDEMRDHLASLMSCPSAVTSELTAMVSFPDLELRPVRTHVAYVGQGNSDTQSIVECWTDEDDDDSDSTLVEVDEDGLVIRYGDAWARIRTC